MMDSETEHVDTRGEDTDTVSSDVSTTPGSPPVNEAGPLMQRVRLEIPTSPPPISSATLIAPGAPQRRKHADDSDSSASDSDAMMWDLAPAFRHRPSRSTNIVENSRTRSAFVQGQGAAETRSRSMSDLLRPVASVPIVAPPPPPTVVTATPAVETFKNVLVLDLDGMKSSFASVIALDTFLFLIAWAPFSLYGAFFFVLLQRLSLALLERYVSRAVIR